jgi:hypothetical protein
MKLPRVRFTVRRMMVGVAVAAVLIGGGIEVARLNRLRASHLYDAAYHARREVEELRNLANFDRGRRGGAANANDRQILLMERASRLRVAYHAELKRKYVKAANRPWESVAPDPKDLGEDLLWESMKIPDTNFWMLDDHELQRLQPFQNVETELGTPRPERLPHSTPVRSETSPP